MVATKQKRYKIISSGRYMLGDYTKKHVFFTRPKKNEC